MKKMLTELGKFSLVLLIVTTFLGVIGNAVATEKRNELIKDAVSAAPASMSKDVTIVDWEGNVLRQGTGSYTCFPTPPNLKGNAPMCFDGPWSKWADAWQNKKSFKISSLGISYMLVGDEGASNVDPYAKGPAKDNHWIEEGPHIMIIVPDESLISDISTDPHNGGPYVMWKGTPYVHVMVPVEYK